MFLLGYLLFFLVPCLAGDCDVFYTCVTLQSLAPALSVTDSAWCCALPFSACRNTTGGLRVVSLTINGGRLRGALCPQLAQLSLLERLDLGGNELSGDLEALSQLPSLSWLDLSFNGDLSGTVAPLSALTRLQFLSLAGCSMRGSLDPLAALTALTTLRLFNNNFVGTAIGLSSMTLLTTLRVAGNPNLGGSLQPFARLTALTWLSIANCAFGGTLSPLANLTNLLYLVAGNNRLRDTLAALATLRSLRSVDLSNNEMYGTLAPLAPACATMTGVVMLDNNRLSGDLSPLAACVNVATLSVQRNALFGNISHVAQFRTITSLALGYNQLQGPVDALRTLTSLKSLVLSANQFTGSLDAISACTALTQLLLDDNRFTGAITPVFTLAQLSSVNVGGNALTGTLAGVGALTNVDTLIVSRNQLSGNFVGHGLRALMQTTKLDVSRNALHGGAADIQLMTASLPKLQYLDVSVNAFAGEFVFDSTASATLLALNVSHNVFHGGFAPSFPDDDRVFVLDGSDNGFTCPLPILPTSVLFAHGKCTQPWGMYTLYLFLAVGLAVAVGALLVKFTQWLTVQHGVLWGSYLCICFHTVNDYCVLISMIAAVASSRIDCRFDVTDVALCLTACAL